jgi:hypothetical protein
MATVRGVRIESYEDFLSVWKNEDGGEGSAEEQCSRRLR